MPLRNTTGLEVVPLAIGPVSAPTVRVVAPWLAAAVRVAVTPPNVIALPDGRFPPRGAMVIVVAPVAAAAAVVTVPSWVSVVVVLAPVTVTTLLGLVLPWKLESPL